MDELENNDELEEIVDLESVEQPVETIEYQSVEGEKPSSLEKAMKKNQTRNSNRPKKSPSKDNTNNKLPNQNLNSRLNNSDKTTPNKLRNLANKNQNFPPLGGSSFNNNQSKTEEDGAKDKVDEAKKKVGGVAVTAATGGAISGDTAEVVADAAMKKFSKQTKYMLIGLGAFALFIFFIFLIVLGGNAENAEVGSSVTPYITGSGTEEDLVKQLKYYGYCKNETDCKSKGIYKFFVKLKDTYEDYSSACGNAVLNDKPCGVYINTSLIIETINYYQKYGDSFSDLESDETIDEDQTGLAGIFSKIANFFRKQQKLGTMKSDIADLALAQSEYVKQTCKDEETGEEDVSYFYQISFDKYISYLKYGKSSTHPNYSGKPVEVESCEGPKNDYIAPTYSFNTTNNSSTQNKDQNGNVTSLSGEGQGVEIVNYALQFVGNPYVYGGSSLTNGIDCSGFTSQVLAHFGINIPRRSTDQYDSASSYGGTVISDISLALPGDLIVYNPNGSTGHVAIYIGDNKIVHASNPKDGIKISDNASYRSIRGIVRYWK